MNFTERFFRAFKLPAALAFVVLCAACSKTPEPSAATPTPTPTIAPKVDADENDERPAPPVSPQIPQASQNLGAMDDDEDEEDDTASTPPAEVIALENKYRTATDEDRKSDIIFELADISTKTAVQSLTRLVYAENSPELRAQLLRAFGDSFATDDEKLAIFSRYIGGDQPQGVREAAVEALDETGDVRSIPIWQRLLNDPDEDIRETAQSAIKLLQKPPAPVENDDDE